MKVYLIKNEKSDENLFHRKNKYASFIWFGITTKRLAVSES